jgi:hypothetical protein
MKTITSILIATVAFTISSGATTTNSTPSTVEGSPHAEAIMLVMKTQQDVIRTVEQECPWWFDTMNREWIVRRPVSPGIIDSTHMFEVTYKIEGDEVARWSVNTNREDPDQKVRLIYSSPKNVPDIKAERQRASELSAIKLLETQKELSAFSEMFSVSDVRAYYGSSMWLYFSDEEWSGDFTPKTALSCSTMAELIFPINTNNVVSVGLSPKQVIDALKDLCDTPFVCDLAGNEGRVRLRAAGDRLHWNTEEIEELILILNNNGINTPPLKSWMHAIIDLPNDKRMISLFHPLESDLYIVGEFDLVKKASWRHEYQEISGMVLDDKSPYIDKKYCPVVDRKGTLRLLNRATGNE